MVGSNAPGAFLVLLAFEAYFCIYNFNFILSCF